MTIRVALDYPRQHVVRHVQRTARLAAGSALLLAGLTGVPAAFVVSGLRPGSASQGSRSDPGNARVVVLVLTISVLGTFVGVRLIRGARNLVLFLRRFGYSEATRAVTFAASGALGRSWRVVTLDDGAIAPVGVASGTRRLFGLGRSGVAALILPLRLLHGAVVTSFWIAVAGMVGIAGLRARHHQSVAPLFNGLTSNTSAYGDIQAFHVLFLIAVVACAAPAVVASVGAIAYVLFGNSFQVARAASRSMREADRSNRVAIETPEQLRTVTRSILRRARKIFSPRLVVVTVAADLWQRAVQQLAGQVLGVL